MKYIVSMHFLDKNMISTIPTLYKCAIFHKNMFFFNTTEIPLKVSLKTARSAIKFSKNPVNQLATSNNEAIINISAYII